ncbi:Crossover junction endonuclease MUS81 [Aphelenchoides bicaudatus]|nr:Crossover junction endonuclease MUS81 [Aphelenchoides bicaudatus]
MAAKQKGNFNTELQIIRPGLDTAAKLKSSRGLKKMEKPEKQGAKNGVVKRSARRAGTLNAEKQTPTTSSLKKRGRPRSLDKSDSVLPVEAKETDSNVSTLQTKKAKKENKIATNSNGLKTRKGKLVQNASPSKAVKASATNNDGPKTRRSLQAQKVSEEATPSGLAELTTNEESSDVSKRRGRPSKNSSTTSSPTNSPKKPATLLKTVNNGQPAKRVSNRLQTKQNVETVEKQQVDAEDPEISIVHESPPTKQRPKNGRCSLKIVEDIPSTSKQQSSSAPRRSLRNNPNSAQPDDKPAETINIDAPNQQGESNETVLNEVVDQVKKRGKKRKNTATEEPLEVKNEVESAAINETILLEVPLKQTVTKASNQRGRSLRSNLKNLLVSNASVSAVKSTTEPDILPSVTAEEQPEEVETSPSVVETNEVSKSTSGQSQLEESTIFEEDESNNNDKHEIAKADKIFEEESSNIVETCEVVKADEIVEDEKVEVAEVLSLNSQPETTEQMDVTEDVVMDIVEPVNSEDVVMDIAEQTDNLPLESNAPIEAVAVEVEEKPIVEVEPIDQVSTQQTETITDFDQSENASDKSPLHLSNTEDSVKDCNQNVKAVKEVAKKINKKDAKQPSKVKSSKKSTNNKSSTSSQQNSSQASKKDQSDSAEPSKMIINREAVRKNIGQTLAVEQETKASVTLVPKGRANIEKVRVEKKLNLLPSQSKVEVEPTAIEKQENIVPSEQTSLSAEQKPLPVKQKPPTTTKKPRYNEIDDCVICCDVELVASNERVRKCKCKTNNKNCSEKTCLNRAMNYECPKKCDNGNQCKNRRFQNREYAKIECFDTEKKGRGVRALESISKGTFIVEYLGEIIDHRKFNKRSKRYAKDPEHTHHYVMSLNSYTYIDATKRGNIARFVNHSCDPNAATEKWTVDRRDRIGFFAIRDIQAGEEIVFDYKFERFGDTAQKCYCGSANCRGVIGSESTLQREEIVEKATQSEEDSSDSSEESNGEESDAEIALPSKSKNVDEKREVPDICVTENSQQQATNGLTEKWQKVGFKDYKIPKKAVKISNNSSASSKHHSDREKSHKSNTEATPPRRRKSRFEPVKELSSPETAQIQPKLIQIPVQNSNSSCSNTCSSSSTPTQQCLTPVTDSPSVAQLQQPVKRRKSRFEPIDAPPTSSSLPGPALVQIPGQPSTKSSSSNFSTSAKAQQWVPPMHPMMYPYPTVPIMHPMSIPPPPNGMPPVYGFPHIMHPMHPMMCPPPGMIMQDKMSRRVKIKPSYPTNLFYEKVLTDWKSNSTDTRGSHTIRKALDSLKIYPLVLNGYSDLRKLKGIGEDIANRLDAAGRCFIERQGDLTLEKVRALKRGDTLVYLRSAVVLKGKQRVPFLSQDAFKSPGRRLGTLADDAALLQSLRPTNELDLSFSQPVIPTYTPLESSESITSLSQTTESFSTITHVMPKSKKPIKVVSDVLLEYNPLISASAAELVLIVDGREERTGRCKSIKEYLTKRSVNYEMRSLAVGDYIWILKLGPTAEEELVLDYIVERKTWDDLKSSIRHSRYAEQKQRLSMTGIGNIIMVVEGSEHKVDRSLEQALASTNLESGFLIKRTINLSATSHFLDDVTKHLKQRINNESIKGHSFAWLQSESQKTKEISVSDCFLRQLTVCPKMSTNKAYEIVRQFPTLRSLRNLYKNCNLNIPLEKVLNTHIPTIPSSLSTQLGQFFKSECPTNLANIF